MKKILLFIALVALATGANGASLAVKPNLAPNASTYCVKSLDYTQITAIETTQNGRLWASILGGGDNANGFLTLAYSDSQGKSWVEAVMALDGRAEKLAVRNGVLWLSPKGELWLFYAVFDGYYDGQGSMWAMVCHNPDEAQLKWSEPSYIGVGIPTGKPVLNSVGEWVLPTALWGREVIGYDATPYIGNKWNTPRFASPYVDKYKELDSQRGAGVYVSKNEGASWSAYLGKVKCADEYVSARYNNPQLFRHDNGSVAMVVRASGTAWSYLSTSSNGEVWKSPTRFVANPDQNFAVQRLADGKLLMVRNARFDRNLYWAPEGLYAYLSEDCGATWYGGLRLATDKQSINPVVAEGKDGQLYIAFQSESGGKGVPMLVSTSVAEIDEANANYENTPKNKRAVLCGGKAAARIAAEMKTLTAPKKSWGSETIRIATYNIQYKTKGWEDWTTKRLPALIALLGVYKFDVFGAQEPYLPQIEDMMKYIGSEYDWIGSNVSGDNNNRNRHFNPIFYRRDRVELLDYDTIWLSDQIAKPGYGAASPRLFTWAKFRDKKTGKIFFHFNGHYDHRGLEARTNSSHMVLDMVKKIAKGMPSFVTADYNSNETSEAYKVLQESYLLKDSKLAVSEPVNAQYQSHGGYRPIQKKPANGMHIDHLFFTPNSVRIQNWELIIDEYEGFYGSDHLPIYVDCKIAN